MRINITMDEELVKKIDEVASKMYVSRSAYIAFAASVPLPGFALSLTFRT